MQRWSSRESLQLAGEFVADGSVGSLLEVVCWFCIFSPSGGAVEQRVDQTGPRT